MSVHGDADRAAGEGEFPRRVYLDPAAPVWRPGDRYQDDQRLLDEGLDRRIDWVRVLAIKAMIALAACGAFALAVVASFTLAWRWVRYGCWCMTRSVLGRFTDMYRWLDQYSPSETEEERQEKYLSLRNRVKTLLGTSVLGWLPDWYQLDWLDLILLVAVVVLVGVGLYGSLALSMRVGRRAILRIRGVQLEAMQPGSAFFPSKIPACQVQISIPGLLFDAHQGFGTRVKNILVTNAHVVEAYSEFVLKGPSGKVLIQPAIVRSRLSEDLAYIPLDQCVWARLGAQASKKGIEKFVSGFATCAGLSGASTGRLSKSTIRGKLVYEGSTLPGMSGAPYMMQGAFVGVHQGAAQGTNIGISADVVRAEMRYLIQKESTHGSSPSTVSADSDPQEQYQSKFKNHWTVEELASMAEDRYHDDSWADFHEDEDFWTKDLQFESRKSAPKAQPKPTCFQIHRADGSIQQIPIDHHNTESSGEVVDVMPANTLDYIRELRAERIVERVRALEQELAQVKEELVQKREQARPERPEESDSGSLAAQPSIGPVVRYPCDFCKQVCRTRERFERHVAASHPVAVESALAEDTGKSGKIIKQTGSFLGKRASSPKRKSGSSATSASKARSNQSLSLEASLSLMLESQRNVEKLLQGFLAGSAGPSSATMLK